MSWSLRSNIIPPVSKILMTDNIPDIGRVPFAKRAVVRRPAPKGGNYQSLNSSRMFQENSGAMKSLSNENRREQLK